MKIISTKIDVAKIGVNTNNNVTCANLLSKTKQNFFKTLNEKKVSDNRTFLRY